MTQLNRITRYNLAAFALGGILICKGFVAFAGEHPTEPIREVSSDEIYRFCSKIKDQAGEARHMMQVKELNQLKAETEAKLNKLEHKRKEYELWLKRRDDFVNKAQKTLVGIISHMKPEAAAAQLAELFDEEAAALLLKLNPRISSLILNELPPRKAARLERVIIGSQRTFNTGNIAKPVADKAEASIQ